jgi:hypothetical protein
MHFATPPTFTITLGNDEMMALDEMLLHYQAHCRKQPALNAEPSMWTRLDATIEDIRHKRKAPPPMVG